jgi:orotate phosphoribosyltransferase-like protein
MPPRKTTWTRPDLAKLTPDQVREARRLSAEGMSSMRIAEHLNWTVSDNTIRAMLNGRTWRHIT